MLLTLLIPAVCMGSIKLCVPQATWTSEKEGAEGC